MSPTPALVSNGEPPQGQTQTRPLPFVSVRFMVLIISILIAFATIGKLYPWTDPWLQVTRGFIVLLGMTWILIGPYPPTARRIWTA